MNIFQRFQHPKFGHVRIIDEDGKILFCGRDVTKALKIGKPDAAIMEHCDNAVKRSAVGITTGKRGAIRKQSMEAIFITEDDLLRLASHSKLPSAEDFTKWAVDEISPVVRKTRDLAPNAEMFVATYFKGAPDDDKEMLLLLLRNNANLAGELEGVKRKALYCDVIFSGHTAVTTTTIAEDYGMSAIALNKHLCQLGIIHKQGGEWVLCPEYAGKEYMKEESYYKIDPHWESVGELEVDTIQRVSVFTNVRWTPKGRMFIYEQMKKSGIVPIWEMEDSATHTSIKSKIWAR